METELKADITRVETELKADITRVEANLKADIGRLEADITRFKYDLIKWIIGIVLGVAVLQTTLTVGLLQGSL